MKNGDIVYFGEEHKELYSAKWIMKNGDIVYFGEKHKALYSPQNESGSEWYHFSMDVGFIVSDLSSSRTCVITDPKTKRSHFIFSSGYGGFDKLIPLGEYRDIKLNKITNGTY